MYERQESLGKAKDEFETVLSLAEEMDSSEKKKLLGNAHFHLGMIYKETSEKEKAEREFENCLKLIPDHKKAKELINTLG